jgi:phosphate uptake regulator
MGRIAVEIGNRTKRIVLECDPDQAVQARSDDDAMDRLTPPFAHGVDGPRMDTRSSRRCRHHAAGPLLRTLADHAVEIGRRAIYQAIGATDVPGQ